MLIKRIGFLSIPPLLLLATTSLQLPHHATRQSSPGPAGPVRTAYGKLPLSFEPNQGQTDRGVDYVARGKGYTLFLTPGEAVLSLARRNPGKAQILGPQEVMRRLQGKVASKRKE